MGRLADGWLGSLLTPDEAGAAVRVINEAADAAGREVEQDHFGLSIPVAFGPVPAALAASIARRRPGIAPADLVADGWAGARRMIAAHVEAGLSKFVVRAAGGDAAADGVRRRLQRRAHAVAELTLSAAIYRPGLRWMR